MNECLFFRREPAPAPAAEVKPLADLYRVGVWTPDGIASRPSGCGAMPYAVWTAFHHLRVFKNRGYRVVQVFAGKAPVHRCCVFPPYFRFPFMDPSDLQLGDLWTHPDHRGKGLAACAAGIALGLSPETRCWYLCKRENEPSISLAERLGFRLVGVGDRRPRLGVRALGHYKLARAA